MFFSFMCGTDEKIPILLVSGLLPRTNYNLRGILSRWMRLSLLISGIKRDRVCKLHSIPGLPESLDSAQEK